jgi:hypothetical protein
MAGWIAEDGGDACGVAIDEDECVALDPIIALPSNGETGIGFLEVQFLRIAIPRQACGEVIGGIEQPGIAGFSREQHQRADGHKPAVVFGGATLNVVDLFGQAKVFARDRCFA